MSVSKLLCLLASAIAVGALSARASDELATTLTFTVPGLESSITAIDLADVDGDGFAEVLATDNHKMVLYSVTRDEILQSLDIDLFYDANGLGACVTTEGGVYRANYSDPFYLSPARVLLADVNRDDRTDALLLTRTVCSGYQVHYVVTMFDDARSGAAPFVALDKSFESNLPIGLCDAVDLDGDGYPSFILSIDSSYSGWVISGFWYLDQTSGQTLVYESFPNAEPTLLEFMIVGLTDLADFGLAGTEVASKSSYSWEDPLTGTIWEYTTGTLALLSNADSLTALLPGHLPFSCYGEEQATTTVRDVGCVGDISANHIAPEVLTPYRWRWRCVNIDVHGVPTAVDSSGAMLILSRIISADSVVDLWTVDVTGHSYQSFFYHPDYSGSFFAIEDDTLFKFDGTDGSVTCRYESLPTGLHIWDYPYEPDRPYLITVNGATITYQSFETTTDVDDPSAPESLPGAFTLGEPYPNPFNPTVILPVTMSRRGHLKVEVFNSLGQSVDVVCDRETSAGEFTLEWDGSRFASGVYLFVATAGDESRTVKAMLLK